MGKNKLEEQSEIQAPGEIREVKRAKKFSAKEFRQNLSTGNNVSALQDFISLCSDKQTGPDCIYEYLEKGGSCIELLNLLEEGTNVPQVLPLEAMNLLLLQIIANHPKHRSEAFKACRYFLNSHVMMINKMLGLSSSGRDRRVVLKLLTAIIMFSDSLAKEILLYINLHSANLELLTKHVESKDGVETVRNTFIHFLLAFLVNDHYPTISLLLTKRGLLPSIVKGLQFDVAESVCMVVTTFRTNILENPLVSKTVKMKTFSTPVVKDIVNLYNWKGPDAYSKNNSKAHVEVNEVDKSRVSEAVHNFLLTLCTSHKFGVIFRDRNLTNLKKHQNVLMYTVLESLERPWEHSYAGELVTKICAACPDLVKTMWNNVKSFLEPRSTVQWLKAVQFAKTLLGELHPTCIEYCAKDLSVQQYAQTVQMLVATTMILKTLLSQFPTLNNSIKHQIVILIKDMLQAVSLYADASNNWHPSEYNATLKKLLHDHLSRNFPTALELFLNWNCTEQETPANFPTCSALDHLDEVLNILEKYSTMCPLLLDTFLVGLKFSDVLEQISSVDADAEKIAHVQIKVVKVFVKFEPSLFAPNTEIFASVMPLLLKTYYDTKCGVTKETIRKILKNTGVFEGCEYEINIWINSVFNVKTWDFEIGDFFVNVIKHAHENLLPFLMEIGDMHNHGETNKISNMEDLLESITSENEISTNINTVKHIYFSPLLLAVFKMLQSQSAQKNVKQYINYALLNIFHYQTNYNLFNSLVTKFQDSIPKALTNYFLSWNDNPQTLSKVKGALDIFEIVSTAVLQSNCNVTAENLNAYDDLKTDVLRMVTFYIINLGDLLTETIYSTCVQLANLLLDNNFDVIVTHASLLQNFSPLHIAKQDFKSFCTRFLMDIVQLMRSKEISVGNILNPYRSKLFGLTLKLMDKGKVKNVEKLSKVIETIGFNFTQCKEILEHIANMEENCLLNDHKEFTIIYNICNYGLDNYTTYCIEDNKLLPLGGNIVTILGNHLAFLNNSTLDTSDFGKAFLGYLNKFPHDYYNIPESLFQSILCKQEYCKENSCLAVEIMKHRIEFLGLLETNIEVTANKKGLFLPLLDVIDTLDAPVSLKEKGYKFFQPSILKVLQKPQKAGQHFEKNYVGLCSLVKQFISEEISRSYLSKVHKFDTTEVFHAHMLSVIFKKFANDEKSASNAILTFIHLLLNLFKQKIKTDKYMNGPEMIAPILNQFVENVKAIKGLSFEQVHNNESYKLFCKFCLKFGIGSESYLIELLLVFIEVINYDKNEINELMDMVTSHSEFVTTLLNADGNNKKAVLDLMLAISTKYPFIMSKNHISLVLGAYSGTTGDCDKVVLQILKQYESVPAQTGFYDFKPMLWGAAASNHYSVRSDIQKSLWRQPRTGDVLDILQESWILDTVKYYPLNAGFNCPPGKIEQSPAKIYDLRFLLPLFSQLLAPENSLQTYRFTKSGALSLTMVALSSDNKEIRMAACHVLARFHFHLEARTSGKDNVLWLRFVEAVCRGTAVFEDFKLNNFASIFLARMALILTKPQEVMYVPLSHYLGAKPTPNLSSIPELYTFLHSSDVNFKEQRSFILEVLRDGLRTDKDFEVFTHAMAHKLLMEIFSSVASDRETKILILEVVRSATALKTGANLFCGNYGLLSWLSDIALTNEDTHILSNLLDIVHNIIQSKYRDLSMIKLMLCGLIDRGTCKGLRDSSKLTLLKCVVALHEPGTEFVNECRLKNIVTLISDQFSKYMIDFKYARIGELEENVSSYMTLLVHNWLCNK